MDGKVTAESVLCCAKHKQVVTLTYAVIRFVSVSLLFAFGCLNASGSAQNVTHVSLVIRIKRYVVHVLVDKQGWLSP